MLRFLPGCGIITARLLEDHASASICSVASLNLKSSLVGAPEFAISMLIRTRCLVCRTITWAALFCAAPCLFLSAEVNASAGNSTVYWAVEDRAAREKLPMYQVIPAATPAELTRANGFPKGKTFLIWERSHGDNGGMRYSALRQINRGNVTNLAPAWIYHSHDKGNALECNPIIVRDLMFTPTPGDAVVAVNAATGTELWRFKPEGPPAFRGLIYWPGRGTAKERVMFCADKFLFALDPNTGQLISDFGEGGKALLPGVAQPGFGAATAAPVIFQKVIIVAGFEKDVWGFDVASGRLLWTFHTVPHPGEFGSDTWDKHKPYTANCLSFRSGCSDVAGLALFLSPISINVFSPRSDAEGEDVIQWQRSYLTACLSLVASRSSFQRGKRLTSIRISSPINAAITLAKLRLRCWMVELQTPSIRAIADPDVPSIKPSITGLVSC
jgi:hypothetical protein